MLGKYFKYEFRSTGRLMAVIYGILAAATVLITVLHILLHNTQLRISEKLFGGISVVLYAATMVVLFVTALVYLCHRFYCTMYSPQGYLTHTLPIKSTQILNIKILSSISYLLLLALTCCLSISISAPVITGEGVDLVIVVINETLTEAALKLGVTKPVMIFFMVILGAAVIIYPIFLCSAGCSIGQLFSRSKGACAIAAVIALYYMTQIVSVPILSAVFLTSYKLNGEYSVKWFLYVCLIILLFWISVYYMVSRVIIQKRLNLE